VTSFWKAYCEQYNDLVKFVDPVEAHPRWSKGVVFCGFFLDLLYPTMQVGGAVFQIADPVAIREVFYVPMTLSYFIIMTRFIYTAYMTYRTVDSVASRRTMGIYLGFSSLFVCASMGTFFLLGSGLYGESSIYWQIAMFLMYFGRAGLSLCDVSIFLKSSSGSSSSDQAYSAGDEERGLTEANLKRLFLENSASNFLATENSRVERFIIERDQEIARLEREKIQSEKEAAALMAIEKHATAYQKQLVENEKNFIASALHEIRNPLNGIGLSLEHIFVSLAPKLDEEVETELRTIESCCSHLSVLLKSVLSLDKLLNGALALPEEAFNPAVIMKNLMKMNKHVAGAGVRLCHVDASEKELDLTVEGAPTQLSLVMLNLINNAAKFTERGEIAFGCSKVEESGNFVGIKFFVADTGVGIPPEKQKFVFGFREQTGTTYSQSKGFGIGLNVSFRLVKLMGGELVVQSPTREADSFGGPGCEFSFIIKMKKMVIPILSSPKTADGGDFTGPEVHGLRVLVVDDGAVNRKMLVRKFTMGIFLDLKFTADSAKTGEQALEMLREPGVQYDLVVMDENMEEAGGLLSGTQTTQAIRDMEKKRGLVNCIIFGCSGNCTEEDERASRASGQDMLWPKPAPKNEEALKYIYKHRLLRLGTEEERKVRLEREMAKQELATGFVDSPTSSLLTNGETETTSEALGSDKTTSDNKVRTEPKATEEGKGMMFSRAKVGSSVKVAPL
jgi:signal transduction histidine kinase/CheY-like chemotaxis protein